MNDRYTGSASRRTLLKRFALFAAGAAVMPLAGTIRNAFAAKLAKADVKYQDTAKAGKDCDDCLQFIPGATPKASGTCKVVDGVISPHGYCVAFTPKPKRT